MATEVDICNLAIGNIRANSINSLEVSDKSTEADACRLRYPHSRDFVLADAWWGFARKTEALALTAQTSCEWTYRYAWPADCLTPRYLVPPGKLRQDGERIPFDIIADKDARYIETNEEDAILCYTFQQTNTQLFSEHFVDALSWHLASSAAVPIVGVESGRRLRADMIDIYRDSLAAAVSANESEQYPGAQRDPESIRARQ